MIELLSPAGSMDALRAAVQNGADAVYLGCGTFNARAGAKNFSLAELRDATAYCHVRGVKVHLTVNTLTTDRERPQVAELIARAAEAGVDAFIVQDPGTVALCRAIAPFVAVHASTQMSIHNLEGVLHAAELGCSRVVLARELSRRDIAYICKHSPVEIEVFVHGALCMCYSGQCYLSSVIGRRSGNRGQCAQPCRLPYGYEKQEDRYPLSLRDNCLISYLAELKSMGVASLKLEGRMKRPEYVAVVTQIYRTALEDGKITAENAARLERVFSRQGFTQGYYEKELGAGMFGIRQDLKEDRELLARARASYENGERSRVGVTFYAVLRAGVPARLAVEDADGRRAMVAGPVPEAARTRPLCEEELVQRLGKTGGTPYYAADVQVKLDPGLSMPVSALNAMRRELLAKLSDLRAAPPAAAPCPAPVTAAAPNLHEPPVLTVAVRLVEQITPQLLEKKPAVLYVPLAELHKHPEVLSRLPRQTELCAVLPRVIKDCEQEALADELRFLRHEGLSSVLCGNGGHVRFAKGLGFAVRGDFGLNVFSSDAAAIWQERGLASLTVSFEATLPQLRDLQKPLPMEALFYGRLPLMVTENCLIKGRTGTCACGAPLPHLTDRRGAQFPIVPDPGTCRSILLNGKILYLLDKKEEWSRLGLWALRLQFTTESPQEVDTVLRQFDGTPVFDPDACTRGLYYRGVE